MDRFPGIFNDILAPVTPGPSSSNTCGVARMAFLCRGIFGDRPLKKAKLEMSSAGNFPASFIGMRSHQAFAHGILGRQAWEKGFADSFADAQAEGIHIEYAFCDDMPGDPPELMRVILTGEDEECICIEGASLGGGNVELTRIDGCEVCIRGYQYELLVKLHDGIEECRERGNILPCLNDCSAIKGNGYTIMQFSSGMEISLENIKFIAGPSGEWRILRPVVPVPYRKNHILPFTTSEEMIAFMNEQKIPLWEAAIRYEQALSGWSREEIIAYAEKLWDIIENSANAFAGDTVGFLEYSPSSRFSAAMPRMLDVGVGNIGGLAALRIMENANSAELVVGIPTVGSAGIVPGALIGAASQLSLERDEIIKGFLSAGLIGIFMSKTNFFGSMGCQMEVGCAAAMAAGGLVGLMGGSGNQACTAASLALQNYIGLVCDTVGGQVASPCLARNVTAVSVAASCANMAVAGVDAVIPLEEMVDAMCRVGNVLFSTKCGKLGARGTNTGLCIAECLRNKPK